jgi:tRNA (adenine37-N6)-methyltransferase
MATDPPDAAPTLPLLQLRPIGVVHSSLRERADAPRQPGVGTSHTGRIELFPAGGMEHALEDLDRFAHIWVLFWFHKNEGWRPKVLPPRSHKRRGVFATRSPYRPNPIGLSVVSLVKIENLSLEVANLDILDGSPVLDLKPYLPYADVVPDAGSGWLEGDPSPDPLGAFNVQFSPRAQAQFDFLRTDFGIDLLPRVQDTLRAGAEPRAYRRIRRVGSGLVLSYKTWRFEYQLAGREVLVTSVTTSYRPNDLRREGDPELIAPRALLERFGSDTAQR